MFNVTFGSTITSDANAATIESTINSALDAYTSGLTTTNVANVTIALQFNEMGSGLGQSSTFVNTVTYTQYRAALVTSSTSADDATALAHLAAGPANPVNGSTSVDLTTALLRALGLPGGVLGGGQFDSTIGLNTSIMNLSRSGAQDPSKYDLLAVVQHEVDEALGLMSALDGLSNGAAAPTGAIGPMDLFRYSSTAGVRSFNTGASTSAFFSLDGTNDLVQFNQLQGGDFHDWFSCPGSGSPARVQDACGSPGSQPNLGVELRALDAVGYTLVSPAPEPASIGLTGLALAAGVVLIRRRRQA
jgi:hypothetical protein